MMTVANSLSVHGDQSGAINKLFRFVWLRPPAQAEELQAAVVSVLRYVIKFGLMVVDGGDRAAAN